MSVASRGQAPPGTAVEGTDRLDRYGGFRDIKFEATGRFRVDRDGSGRWWFVTPDGHAFFSHGLQCVGSRGTLLANGDAPYETNILRRHGSKERWRARTLELMDRAGLNTVGDFSEKGWFRGARPYVDGVMLSAHAPVLPRGPDAFRGRARDFFDPAFRAGAHAEIRGLHESAADPFCIGVFLDDEVSWAASFLMPLPYLDYYLFLPAGAPGKVALQAFLEDRHRGDLAAFNSTWNTDLASFGDVQSADPESRPWASVGEPWLGTGAQQADRAGFRCRVADEYHAVAAEALAAHAPGLLNLGSRILAGNVSADVVEVAARHTDVVSINAFDVSAECLDLFDAFVWTGAITPEPLFADIRAVAAADAPILLSSFSYRAGVDGLNDFPPTLVFDILPTQQDRAERYEAYMRAALEIPQVVGAHWFQHADQPAGGRFDGENSNFGIVDIDDEPYEPLVDRMRLISRDLHSRGRRSPTAAAPPTGARGRELEEPR